ncbi:MAG: hypothetical protein ACPIOQ_83330, partial [Promethearchaeia archaeon]
EIGRSLQTLWSIHHGMLTISVEATPGDRAFTRVAVRLAVEEVAVSILPGHHRLFTLSSQLGDRTDEVYCYAQDQRARNKWIARFPPTRPCDIHEAPRWEIELCARADR